MLTTAVISILVVQNRLLCGRKVQEPKKAKFSTFPAISPDINNLLNTFFESIVQRVNFRSSSILCHSSCLPWPSYYFCCCCCSFLCVMEIATKTVDDTVPTVIGISTNKTYQRLHKNRVHIDFSLRVCQIHLVPFTMILILYFVFMYLILCFAFMYLIQNNSYLLELNREYFDDLWLKWKVISNPRTTFNDLFPWSS